jgi:Ca-activated chloride channel family protein
MSKHMQWVLLVLGLLLVLCGPAMAYDSDAQKAQSPYFFVKSSDPELDQLPLKSTRVTAQISGVIANVTVVQQYRNEGQRPIEARYVFPGSTGAAVHALSVRLGDRLIEAKIRERQQARIEYEQAKTEGRTTALLEQERPNVFSMNVANILPNDDVLVELHYTELIAPTDRKYQFVFPTVVGPRYAGTGTSSITQGGSGEFPAVGYHPQGTASESKFELEVQFDSPLAVTDIASSTHPIKVTGMGYRHGHVTLDASKPGNDRDFILDYRLAADRTAGGLKLYEGPDENFFVAVIEPPKVIQPAEINPRDYIFVVDVSGSMHGFPLDTAKELLRKLIGSLRPTDTFNVMLFSGSNRMLNESSIPATAANIEAALRTIDDQQGGGGTELVPAIRRVLALPKAPELSRSIIVVTDGYVSFENEVFALVRRNLNNANLFAFGIGTAVNRHLMEGLARAGQGESFIVTRPDEAARQADRLRKMIDSPVLTHLQAKFEGIEAYDVEPSVLPDVLAGRPVVIMGKWRSTYRRVSATLQLSGQKAGGPWKQTIRTDDVSTSAVELEKLWARSRIRQLTDDEALTGTGELKPAITQLGLKYSLLSQYTSFIAVDKVVRHPGPMNTVNQPSPLPAGVGNSAIGAEVPSTPEPSTCLALAVVLALLITWGWRARRVAVDSVERVI